MRFYNIVITKPDKPQLPVSSQYNQLNDGVVTLDDITVTGSGPIKEWASYNEFGYFNPNALMVEFDLQSVILNAPTPGSMVKIYGISLADISQATDLNNMLIEIYGGMGPGLPLANPNQAGLLIKGQIIRAFGNWIGTDQSLCLMLTPSAALAAYKAGGITFEWAATQNLGDSIKAAIRTGFPASNIDMTLFDGNAAVVYDDNGAYPNLVTFALWLYRQPEYSDIEIYTDNDTIYVSNAKGRANKGTEPIQILPTDLIGQPTWIDTVIIQITLVMRADIKIGSIIELPTTMYTSSPTKPAPNPSNSQAIGTFQGKFLIRSVRHVGNSRSTDSMGWVTIVEGGVAK